LTRHYKEQNTDKLHQAPHQYEQMEDGMQVTFMYHKKRYSSGVENTAAQEEEATPEAQRSEGGNNANQDAPSHQEIADHCKFMEFLQVNGGERDTECGAPPHESENRPT
jgi:hypothetical protein